VRALSGFLSQSPFSFLTRSSGWKRRAALLVVALSSGRDFEVVGNVRPVCFTHLIFLCFYNARTGDVCFSRTRVGASPCSFTRTISCQGIPPVHASFPVPNPSLPPFPRFFRAPYRLCRITPQRHVFSEPGLFWTRSTPPFLAPIGMVPLLITVQVCTCLGLFMFASPCFRTAMMWHPCPFQILYLDRPR